MDSSPNSRLLKSLFPVIRRAGSAVMDIYTGDDYGESQKPDGTPITLADIRSHEIIVEGIRSATSDIPIISEEDSIHSTHSLPSQFFLIDPLDGTDEFLRCDSNSVFTLNIALIEDHRPIFGLIYAPTVDRLFSGVVGEGAVESSSNRTFSITTSSPSDNLRALTSLSHPDSTGLDYLRRHDITTITPLGSSLKFCLLACGEADIYARFSPTMAWDTAAGDAILRSAGGRVINAETHEPLTYGIDSFCNPFFIASGS